MYLILICLVCCSKSELVCGAKGFIEEVKELSMKEEQGEKGVQAEGELLQYINGFLESNSTNPSECSEMISTKLEGSTVLHLLVQRDKVVSFKSILDYFEKRDLESAKKLLHSKDDWGRSVFALAFARAPLCFSEITVAAERLEDREKLISSSLSEEMNMMLSGDDDESINFNALSALLSLLSTNAFDYIPNKAEVCLKNIVFLRKLMGEKQFYKCFMHKTADLFELLRSLMSLGDLTVDGVGIEKLFFDKFGDRISKRDLYEALLEFGENLIDRIILRRNWNMMDFLLGELMALLQDDDHASIKSVIEITVEEFGPMELGGVAWSKSFPKLDAYFQSKGIWSAMGLTMAGRENSTPPVQAGHWAVETGDSYRRLVGKFSSAMQRLLEEDFKGSMGKKENFWHSLRQIQIAEINVLLEALRIFRQISPTNFTEEEGLGGVFEKALEILQDIELSSRSVESESLDLSYVDWKHEIYFLLDVLRYDVSHLRLVMEQCVAHRNAGIIVEERRMKKVVMMEERERLKREIMMMERDRVEEEERRMWERKMKKVVMMEEREKLKKETMMMKERRIKEEKRIKEERMKEERMMEESRMIEERMMEESRVIEETMIEERRMMEERRMEERRMIEEEIKGERIKQKEMMIEGMMREGMVMEERIKRKRMIEEMKVKGRRRIEEMRTEAHKINVQIWASIRREPLAGLIPAINLTKLLIGRLGKSTELLEMLSEALKTYPTMGSGSALLDKSQVTLRGSATFSDSLAKSGETSTASTYSAVL